MKFDQDCIVGIKMVVFILGVLGLLTLAMYLISIAVKTSDAYQRSEMLKDMAMWKSKGCIVVDIKGNYPVYKCGGKE